MREHQALVGFVVICMLTLACGVAIAKEPADVASISPDVALDRLKEGNRRFVANPISKGKPTAARRAETAKAQHPFAIIVACSDSRTPPELIFDQNIGDLFVARTAGNVIDDHTLGGIEFAVGNFGPRLVVVLGHERCGAVKAAMESATAPGHINSVVRDIQPAVKAAKGEAGDALTNTAKENARLMAEKISHDADFGEHKAEVRVVTGYYDLDTGVVHWPASGPAK